jgi:uncharacterized protein (TIGR02246 family)
VLSVADQLEIQALYARYAFAFDGGDADTWAALFAPAGTFLIDGQLVAGREALRAFATKMFRPPGMRHFVSNLLLTTEGEAVRGRAYVQVLRISKGESLRLLNVGDYDDVIIRRDDGWLFEARTFTSWLPAPLADSPLAHAASA